MKILAFILPVLWFLYHSQTQPGSFRHRYNYSYSDTPIVGPVVHDQNEVDTNTAPPPDTIPIPPSGLRHDLIFEELYNDLPIDSKVKGFQESGGSCCLWSQALSDSFYNTAPTSNRFEIRLSDPFVGGSHRSEDNYQSNGEPLLNFERWFGFKVYFPVGYTRDVSPEIFAQLHAADSNSPPVALWTNNDRISFAFNGGSNQDYGAIPKGSWVVFVIHVIWDTDPAVNLVGEGLIDIWMDDVKRTSRSGMNSPAGLAFGPYPKWGIYKWPWAHLAVNNQGSYVTNIDVRSLYIDDVRYGTALSDYASVRP